MNTEQQVDSLINELEDHASNRVKSLSQLRSNYTKQDAEYWTITAELCKEKARRLRR